MNVLVSYHTDPRYMSPAQFSPSQVSCGPFYEDANKGGVAISRKTPVGMYDIKPIVESLPISQRPDLIIVKSDATRMNFPRNIGSLGIPSVLVIGDTQHQKSPLQTLIRYAAMEKYTVYVADHVRRHLHFFLEAGLRNVFWAPALNLRDWKIPFQQRRTVPLTFVGQSGKFHPFRRAILERLAADPVLQLHMGTATQAEASKIYASSECTLNLSMNGDVNLRVFEVLAAGGFLLTDRLHSQAGMDLLFQSGVHLETFADYDELRDKCLYYRAHPDEAMKIAWRGYSEFRRSHTPELKHRQLFALACKGRADDTWCAHLDRRSIATTFKGADAFFNRIANYEYFQQRQLDGASQRILFSKGADPALAADLADLYRANVFSLATDQRAYFQRAGVAGEVTIIERMEEACQIDSLVVSASEVESGSAAEIISTVKTKTVLVDDLLLDSKVATTAVAALTSLGYAPTVEHPNFFEIKN